LKTLGDKEAELLASKERFIFDIDGCVYPRDEKKCGFYQQLSKNVKKAFAKAVVGRGDFKGVYKVGFDTVASNPGSLSVIFSGITSGVKEVIKSKITGSADSFDKIEEIYQSVVPLISSANIKYPEQIFNYAISMYGNSYDMIKPDADLTEATRIIMEKGIKVNFYTNSPSSKENDKDAHVQKVLKSLGYSPVEVNSFREVTYDMFDAIGDLSIGKPSVHNMQTFLSFADIKDTSKAVMFDDNIKNLKTAAFFGIQPVWTWTDSVHPSMEDMRIADSIDAIIISDVGKSLSKIAKLM